MSRRPTAGTVLVLTLLGSLAVLATASPTSADGKGGRRPVKHAEIRGDDPKSVDAGNGKRNRTFVDIKSPTVQRGTQHTSTQNAGGATNVQSALCKNVKVCHITLQIIVRSPEKPKVKKAETTAREDGDTALAQETRPDDDDCPA
ncbi:hypothetical protein [Sphaerisporangium aureirubrum]|uniref:Secreted protein n=1 Tax=Sphaerisporangium aureirubrum TaxID=1544736 RepID=A0ABW1NGV2_9ACTN